jgi:hypothetical protein
MSEGMKGKQWREGRKLSNDGGSGGGNGRNVGGGGRR